MPASFASCAAVFTFGQSTAMSTIASAWSAIADRMPLLCTVGSNPPSETVTFQPIRPPASEIALAGIAHPSAAVAHGITQTFLPAAGLGAEAGSARSVPA